MPAVRFCPEFSFNQFRFQPFQRFSSEFQIRHRVLPTFRKLIIGAPVQFPSGLRFADAAPLFEKEGNFRPLALRADVPHPFDIHWPRARPALAADNHPVDAPQIDRAEMFQQRFDGKETDLRGRVAEQIYARQTMLAVFHAYAPPDMRLLGCETTRTGKAVNIDQSARVASNNCEPQVEVTPDDFQFGQSVRLCFPQFCWLE